MKITLGTKFLYSYIIIFLLPILCLGTFTFFISTRMLTEDAMSKNVLTLQKASNLVDNQMQQIYEIPIKYSLNDTYRDFRMKFDPYKVLAVQKDLKNTIITNNFIHDLFLYFYDDDYLISSTTTVTLNGFQEYFYEYENWSDEDFIKDLNTVSIPSLRSSENVFYILQKQLRVITFMAPVGHLQGDSYASMLIVLDADILKETIENSGILKESNFMMLDSSRKLLYSFDDINYSDSPEYLKLLEQNNTDGTFNFNGKKHHLSQRTSPITGITYMSVTPLSALTGSVSQLQLLFSIGLCLITGFAGLAIAFFLNRNYTPIKSLKQFSEAIILQHSEENPFIKDDFGQIRRCLEYLNDNNLSLQKQVMNSKDYMRDCLIFDLIRGEFSTLKQFNEKAVRADIMLEKGLYTVAVLHSKSYNVQESPKIIEKIENHFDVSYKIYGHQHLDSDKIILVINLSDTDISFLNQDMSRLCETLAEKFGQRPTIGLGRLYNQVDYISKAFIEATVAADYHIVRGSGRVILYDECVPSVEFDQIITPSRVELLGKYLRAADKLAIQAFLNEIRAYIGQAQVPIYIVKSLCFDIIREIQKTTLNLYEISDNYTDTLKLLEYETADELLDILDNICSEICDLILNQSQKISLNKITEMIHYIKNNCKDPDFSTDKMAEAFETSSPTLCQYFKSKTNKTITDYLVDFRISRAKDLLTETSYPLSQISYEVGYYNVSSFIRRFKQMVGSSPGVYREQNKK